MASVSTWSGIRNKLEQDYLCPALRGHIQYSHPFLPCGYMDHAWAASRTVEELDAVAGSHIQAKNSMTHGMMRIRPAINSTFRSRTWKSGPTGTGI